MTITPTVTRVTPLYESNQPTFPVVPAWTRQAACQDAEPGLFDEHTDAWTLAQARSVCADCPVATQCLAWGVETRAWGTWGGQHLAGGRVSRRY